MNGHLSNDSGLHSARRPENARPAVQAESRYNAFISYSHAVDGRLAPALRKALHRFAKPRFQLRALRVFRDDASLAANPNLWQSIEQALSESEYLILLASPEAAASKWVAKEVETWCDVKSVDTILIVLTDGEIVWDAKTGDFDWESTSALPAPLRGVFTAEPRWTDLCWAREAQDLSLNHLKFRECVADLAAPLHHRPKDELLSEDVRLLRRAKFRSRITIVVISGAALALAVSTWLAVEQRNVAEEQRDRALINESHFLLEHSIEQTTAGNATNGMLLALEGMPDRKAAEKLAQVRPLVWQAPPVLYRAIRTNKEKLVLNGHEATVSYVEFTPDGHHIVSRSYDGTARLWNSQTGSQNGVWEGNVALPIYFGDTRGSVGPKPFVVPADGVAAGLWTPFDADDLTQLGRQGRRLLSVEVEPDSGHVVTASDDHIVHLWDAMAGEEPAIMRGHTSDVTTAALSVSSLRIVTASQDKTVRLWDMNTGQSIAVLGEHDKPVTAVAFSPDGERLLTIADYRVRLWNTKTAKEIPFTSGAAQAHRVHRTNFSPDSSRVALNFSDGGIDLFDARTGKYVGNLEGEWISVDQKATVTSFDFSPDSRNIVTGSLGTKVSLWSAETAKRLADLEGHEGTVTDVAFYPDGSRILTVSKDKTARIWDSSTGEELAVLRGHVAGITTAAVSSNGRVIVTASEDHTLRVWDLSKSGEELAVLQEHASYGEQFGGVIATVSPASDRILTQDTDNTARLWDAETGTNLGVLSWYPDEPDLFRRPWVATFSPSGSRVITRDTPTSGSETLRLWDVATGEPLHKFSGHLAHVQGAQFSPSGERIVTASNDRTARVWNADTAEELLVLSGHSAAVSDASYSPDGKRIVTVSYDRTVRLWAADTGAEISTLIGHEYAVDSVKFSPGGSHLLTVGGRGSSREYRVWDASAGEARRTWTCSMFCIYDISWDDGIIVSGSSDSKQIQVWETATGQDLFQLSAKGRYFSSAQLSPDANRLVTAGDDKTVDVWDARTGEALLTMPTNDDSVDSAKFSFDGRLIITTSRENVRLWDADAGIELAVLRGHEYYVGGASFTPDGSRIVTVGKSTARVWQAFESVQDMIDYAKQISPRCLTPSERETLYLTPKPLPWCIETGKWPFVAESGATLN